MLKEQKTKLSQQNRRAFRTRSRISGTAERPRLSVHVSHKHVVAQIINDAEGKTLAYISTVKAQPTGTLTKKAEWAGTEIAKAAAKAKIKQVSFDRGAQKYHARLAALANAARSNGLEF